METAYLHPSGVMNETEAVLLTPVTAVTLFLDEMVTLYHVYGARPARMIDSVNDVRDFAPY